MNYKMIGRILALVLAVEAIFMIPAFLLCLADGDGAAASAFAVSMGIIALSALLLYALCRRAEKNFYARDGMFCVGFGWIAMSLLGCLPFVLSGAIPNYIDALFEIVSGFTTTGASILPEVEHLPRGILFWRSFSHWLGGMGVLVFVLAVMPDSGRGGGYTLHLLRAESPGPDVGKLVPRMKRTAAILYLIYLVLTILNVLFLVAGRMSLFESLCTAFGCAGTGGFSVKNDSLAGYSPYLQTVCTVFMLLFGVNFSCYYLLLCRRVRSVLRDEELRLYLGIAAASTLLIAINIRADFETIGASLHHAAFQVSSIMTTTGYATVDFDLWPTFSKAILLTLMVVGACGGSTGGGIKCGRLVLLFKTLRRNVQQALHPQKVQVVRLNGRVVDERILTNTSAYLAAYVVIVTLSFLVLCLEDFSLTTNFAAVLACFNNIGPGLEAVGPISNYGTYGVLSKLVLTLDMLAGRLEIYPILALFSGSAWKRR
ncbi:MAG: TrkH family potassium uptake protein [Oscillospiraceae bacterium]|nr:TrkH family potassium uptake protein [Oscillospiraceae bacterium]